MVFVSNAQRFYLSGATCSAPRSAPRIPHSCESCYSDFVSDLHEPSIANDCNYGQNTSNLSSDLGSSVHLPCCQLCKALDMTHERRINEDSTKEEGPGETMVCNEG